MTSHPLLRTPLLFGSGWDLLFVLDFYCIYQVFNRLGALFAGGAT